MKRKKTVRQTVGVSLVLTAALFILPLFFLQPLEEELFGDGTEESTEFSTEGGKEDGAVRLKVLVGGQVEEMDLGTYLAGVVRAEMPASFQQEALKAQSVAARTYTMHKLAEGGRHENADICTDSTCCQAWSSEEAARKNWGRNAQEFERAVENAVASTDGEILLYGGEPILAVFHASSSGLTRAAGDVWQNDVPYLTSVDSPETGAGIPDYYSRKSFTEQELRARLAPLQLKLTGDPEGWLRNAVTDPAGSVETVEIGGVPVKGTLVRELLGLRSACFTWEKQGKELVFFVTGHGHGVGMSQYGAQQMAEKGVGYREILAHYYVGTELGKLSGIRGQISPDT